MIPPPPSSTLHSILDIYQACQARGEYAKVILETKRGKTMVNFCSCEEGFPTTPARRAGQLPKKGIPPLTCEEARGGEQPGEQPELQLSQQCPRQHTAAEHSPTVTIFPYQLSLS